MKLRYVIIALLILVVGFATSKLIENQNKELKRVFHTNSGEMRTYDPDTSDWLRPMPEYYFESKKEEKQRKILTIAGSILSALLISLIFVIKYENRLNPIKNLEHLKNENIITNLEYNEKLKESKNSIKRKKEISYQQKEERKLIQELENLRKKGILSQLEFEEKCAKVREKTVHNIG